MIEKPIGDLTETEEMMSSSDYKERFKAEYYQLEYRTRKLEKMLNDWKQGKLDFEPTCTYGLLDHQRYLMKEYMRVLEQRAEIEGIELR